MDDQRKRKRGATDYNQCIICQNASQETLQRLTSNGLPALTYAVTHRTDETAKRLLDELTKGDEQFLDKNPMYHAKCRNSYTNKKTVAQKSRSSQKVQPEADTSLGDCLSRTTRGSFSTKAVSYKTECFICRRQRTSKGEHKMLLVTTADRQNSVWKKAKELNDKSMLHHIQGFADTCIDMIANDFRYHRSCLAAYLTRTELTPISKSDSVHDAGIHWLASYIDDELSKDPQCVIFLSTLREKYRNWLQEKGATNATSYRSSSLKKRIEDYYAQRDKNVMVVPQKGQSSIICSSTVSIGYLLSKVASMKEQMQNDEYAEESDDDMISAGSEPEKNSTLYHSAKTLRSEIKHTAANLKTDRSSEGDTSVFMDITHEAAVDCIPVALYNHVAWLVTDKIPVHNDPEVKVQLQDSDREKVLNLAQDICVAVASIPTPKHIGTALHVLKQTRSKELVTMLNRFGNSVSYQEGQRYITAMAQTTGDDQEQQQPLVPTNLKMGLFTQCAIDNLDFHEHTPDGTTMHGTTHNIYQYSNDAGDVSRSAASVPLSKKPRKASYMDHHPFQTRESGLTLRDRQQSRALSGLSLVHRPIPTTLLSDRTVVWQLTQKESSQTDDQQSVVSWNYFNDLLVDDDKPQTLIGYGPFYPESPTNPDVVEASVEYCITVTQKLGQQHCVLTCDQAIYEIALGLQKKKPDKYQHLILRMGGFHIANNFLGAIGSLFKSSGIETVLVEAKAFRAGTMNKLMSGKDYYGMVRCHSLMFSTMFELYWESFEAWALVEPGVDLEVIASLTETIQKLTDALANGDKEAAKQAQSDVLLLGDAVQELLSKFDTTFCNSPTAKLWIMYINMILILKRYIEAERAGLWENHLTEVENMLPYLVSAGHIKYVACIPHYLEAMKNLPAYIATEFQQGHFNVRITSGKFNGVWTDMALEQTYNREAKTQLFKGITQQASAREKYLRALPALTAVSEQTKAMVHLQDFTTKAPTNSKAASDRAIVNTMKDLLKQDLINPFRTSSQDLLNIATGEKCQSLDLLEAKQRGISALTRAQQSKKSQVETVRLATFDQKSTKKTKSSQLKIYQEESSILRSLCFSQDMDKDAFGFEWTEYPASLFTPDADMTIGYAMRKGNKAEYVVAMKEQLSDSWIEKDALPTTDDDVLFVVDAMAFIHRHQDTGCSTFSDLQRRYFKKLMLSRPPQSACVSFVGDRYDIEPTKSLKLDERSRRQKTQQSSRTYEIKDNLPIPHWKTFIANSMNKAALQDYLQASWTEHHKEMPRDVQLVLGGLSKQIVNAAVVTTDGSAELPELTCADHEEADTRIFAHISYCVSHYGYQRAVIQASDTDILVMAIYYSVRIPGLRELWVQKGSTYIPCHVIASLLGEKNELSPELVTSTLLCGHIMSGCDTVSYVFGKGKKKAFKVAMMNASHLMEMMQFSNDSLDVTEIVINACRTFFLKLYADFSGSLDDLRAHIFGRIKGDIRKLPPTEGAFKYHMLRGLYQIATCKRAHMNELSLPNATSFGREIRDGHLVPIMTDKPSKPPSAKPKRYCQCSKSKCKRNCSCAAAGVNCVASCKCLADPNKCARITEESEDDE